ncbi:MAG: hypothetical protein V4673_14560 [Pseudomonadota bacterium]
MGKTNAALLAMNRGEVSKIALARIDLERMRLSAECQLNWMPTVVGAMSLRPGLQYVGETRGSNPALLVPFVYSKFDTALLELTANVLRIRVNDVLLSRVSVATAISDPTFNGGGAWTTAATTSGCAVGIGSGLMTLAAVPIGGLAQAQQIISIAGGDFNKEHGLRVVVVNGPVTLRLGSGAGLSDLIAQSSLDTGTHSLAFTPTSGSAYLQIESTDGRQKSLSGVSIEAGGVLEIPTPWAAPDLSTVRHDQSGDIIFSAAYGVQQYKIERRSTSSWSVVKYRSDNGPFGAGGSSDVNLTPSVYDGNGTLTSDRPYFQPGHEGALFRLFSPGQVNQSILGAANAFTPAVRVNGVGTAARNYSWTLAGTYVGTLTLQRSFDGPDSGFTDVATGASGSVTTVSSATGTGGTPNLDNVIAWERIGFKAGAYTSGNVTAASTFLGGGGYGICRVTQYTSPTEVAIEVLEPFSSLLATNNWAESDWSNLRGWPTSVAFHDGRLAFAGRDQLWCSQGDNFTGFAQQDSQGNELADAGAIIETFGAGAVDSVNWLLSLLRLLAGREQQISSVRSSSLEEVLTPSNASAKDCSTQGAARLKGIKIDKDGIMVEQDGRRVYLLSFNANKSDYGTSDLTRLNLDIGKPGFVDLAVARQPDTVIPFVRRDGQVANILFEPEDEVTCWYRYQTLGLFENVCTMPTATGIETAQYFVVKRVVNGVTRRFIEKLAPRDNCIGGDLCQLADSHVVYQGAPATTITLAHLPNTDVIIWADGKDRGMVTTDGSGVATMPGGAEYSTIVAGLGGEVVTHDGNGTKTNTITVDAKYEGLTAEVFTDRRRIGTLTVSGGQLTLPNGREEGIIIACFGYVAPFYSSKLAYAAQGGTALTKKKKIDALGLVLFDTHQNGIRMGQSFFHLDPLPAKIQEETVDPDHVWDEFDEPMMSVPGTWDTDARLCLLAQAPRPAKVGAVVVGIETNG